MNADHARDRMRVMVNAALADAHIAGQLDAILDALVKDVEADPELRHQVIRDSLRSTIMSNFWLRS
ncbi:MAG TPA: hypothetical protein VGJ60_21975 [Chloroflexota bacterium]|jgi:hypothetical protein